MNNKQARPLTPAMITLISRLDDCWDEADSNDAPDLAWTYLHGTEHASFAGIRVRDLDGMRVSSRSTHYGVQARLAEKISAEYAA